MKFEEALKELREGKKITHDLLGEDVYLAGCYITFPTIMNDDGTELNDTFEDAKARGMSIVIMKGDREHPDMRPRLPFIEHMELIDKYPFLKEKITYPTLNLLLIMSDEWRILE